MNCNINLAIEHDIANFDSSMPITNLLLCEFMYEYFHKIYHINAPEFIRLHMCEKLSKYLSKNFIDISMQYDDEKSHIINKLYFRCRGIVRDIRKYIHDAEIQYFFTHINELYAISFNDELYKLTDENEIDLETELEFC